MLNSASTAPAAIWLNQYTVLNAATRVILAAEDIEPPADSLELNDYNNAVGVAHALRAWAHFELLTYFSPDLTDDACTLV